MIRYDGRKVRVVEAKCKVMEYEGEMKKLDCSKDPVIQISGEEERIGEHKREYSIVRAHVRTSAKKPYCPSILVDTISMSWTLDLDVIAVTSVADLSLEDRN